MVWIYTITSVVLVGLVSVIGLFFLSLKEKFLKKIILLLVSFSAGVLLGDAFIHILPEAVSENGFTVGISLSVLGGMILFFILEELVFWHHCHNDISGKCHPFVYMNLVGDVIHNFIDGMIIAASYLVSIPLGLITTMAVFFHEVPQEIGDFGVLLHGGFSRKKALLLNLLSAASAIVGAVLVLMIGSRVESATPILLSFSAGGFIYIATADLIPELRKTKKSIWRSVGEFSLFILGIVVMFLFLFIE